MCGHQDLQDGEIWASHRCVIRLSGWRTPSAFDSLPNSGLDAVWVPRSGLLAASIRAFVCLSSATLYRVNKHEKDSRFWL